MISQNKYTPLLYRCMHTNTLGLTSNKVIHNNNIITIQSVANNSFTSPSKFLTGSQNKGSFIQDIQNGKKNSSIVHNSYYFNKRNINLQLSIENNTKNILESFIKTTSSNMTQSLYNSKFDTMQNTDKKIIQTQNSGMFDVISTPSSFQQNILLSKPSFYYSQNKVDIQVFYYIPTANYKINIKTPANTSQTEHHYTNLINNQYNDNIEVISTNIPSFFHSNSSISSSNTNSIYNAVKYLSKQYNKEVSLTITRIHYPYMDSYILAQYLAYNAKTNSFIKFQESLFENAAKSLHISDISLRSHITGIKIQLSGRITTEPVIPRITVKSSIIGSFSIPINTNISDLTQEKGIDKKISPTHTLNQTNMKEVSRSNSHIHTIDYSKFISKNELGSFAIKVWIASNINIPI